MKTLVLLTVALAVWGGAPGAANNELEPLPDYHLFEHYEVLQDYTVPSSTAGGYGSGPGSYGDPPGFEWLGCFATGKPGLICSDRPDELPCSITAASVQVTSLTSGALQDCQVARFDLLDCMSSQSPTDADGTVSFSNGTLALYSVPTDESCKDSTTGQYVRWLPNLVIAPPTTKAFITAISTLSLAASRDPEVLDMLNLTAQEAIGSRTILRYVFSKYGYDEASMGMDLLTFDGASIARPAFTAFYGSNIQLAGVFSILMASLAPLLDESPGMMAKTPHEVLMEELSAVIFNKLKNDELVKPHTTYINTDDTTVIAGIMLSTYNRVAAINGQPSIDAAKLTGYFQGIAQVVDKLDNRLRGMIATAKLFDEDKDDFDFTMPMATIMAMHDYVAQGAAAYAARQLAVDITADPSVDLTAPVKQLKEEFSGHALTSKFSSTGLTQLKAFKGLLSSGLVNASLPTPDDNTTVKVPSKPGLLGLLGLLGPLGLIGIIPAVLSIPAGVLLVGSLLLAPTGTTVPGTPVGTLVTNCINDVPVTDIAALGALNPQLPVMVLQQIAGVGVCLPGGKIYDSTNFTGTNSTQLPLGTVVVGSRDNQTTTIILPPGTQANSSNLPANTTVYPGNNPPPGANTGGATLPGDPWTVTPGPIDTCRRALPPIVPLSAIAAAGMGNLKLQSALRGIGALSSCAGSYYSYTELSPADQEKMRLNAFYFNKDFYGTTYKDFVTGPLDAGIVVTRGTFGVENVTGPGHFMATGAWKGSSQNHNGEVNCLDSWTLLPVKIPVGGLTPFPGNATSQENWAEHVVATPVTMATLGQGSAAATIASLQAKYDTAYQNMGAKIVGQYTQGMLNSDPLRMLTSGNVSQVTAAVTVLAANAQALGALTIARALAECKGTSVSNELYAKWAAELLKASVLENALALAEVLSSNNSCLNGVCATGAAKAFVSITTSVVSLKAAYKSYTTVPPSLQEDLLTITRAARVVQSDLYNSTKLCCSSTPQSTAPFMQYTSNLGGVLSSAPVNQTAVLELGSYPAATPSTSSPVMAGRLLNSAGVKNCVGKYAELPAQQVTHDLVTDSTGAFSVVGPVAAAYTFKKSYPSSTCVDALTNVTVTFPFSLRMPAAADAAVTAISLLTVPASSDASVLAAYAASAPSQQLVPAYLWQHAYSMYGYGSFASNGEANFLSLGGAAFSKRTDGKTPALLVAVLGSNTQTMSTFVSTQNLMMGLLGNTYGADAVAQAVVAGAYRTFKMVDATNASETLTASANLVSLYSTTYGAITSDPAVTTGRHLLQSTMTSAQLQNIFGAVANVVSSTNQQVQQVVNTATVAAADPSSTVDTSNLMVSVSKMAAVQQQSLASDVGTLATEFAANPTTDQINSLQESYSGPALEAKLAAVKIDKAAVEAAMDTLSQPATPVPTESIKSLAWVAAPVVCGCAFIAACGLLYWWFKKRSAAQATQSKDQYMETMAEARSAGLDGGTPREESSRAQASLN